MAATTVGVTHGAFSLTVDYDQSLVEMVAAGNYDSVNPHIADDNFPVGSGEPEVEAVLVYLDHVASYNKVIQGLGRRDLRPATLPELLAFGAKYPDLQRQYPIVALGSVWAARFGIRRVGCLWSYYGQRKLYLLWYVFRCDKKDRFLAVRK